MLTILAIGIVLALFGYHGTVLAYARRTRWLEKRLRQYIR